MGLTQVEMGLALGMSSVNISRIENGHRGITMHTAVQVGVMVALFKQKRR